MAVQIYVKIDGTDVSEKMMDDIISVEVDQSLFLPDMFSLQLSDHFDLSSDKFIWADSDSVALGKSVEIAIESDEIPDSPSSVKATLLAGEITSVEPEFSPDGGATIVIRGYDKSHRLHRGKQIRAFVQKSDSDIAKQIAGECGLSANVESTSEVHKLVIQDNQTNMEFLQDRARRVGYFIYVKDGKLHFRRTPEDTSSGGEKIVWGQDLMDFQIRLTAAEQVSGATARGWDMKEKKAIESGKITSAKDKPEVGAADIAKKAFGDSDEFVTHCAVATPREADCLAQATFDEIRNASIQAEGTCRGNPRLSAGTKVELEGIGKRFSGHYRISRAVHRYGRGDYDIRFEVSGRRANTLGQLLETKGGANYGVAVGIVTNNQDPDGLGRVKLKYPTLAGGVESWWARQVSPMAGPERGFEFIPEVNDEVLVAFENEDINRPFVLGGLWNGKDKPPEASNTLISGGKVQKRIIRSRSGHTIILDDTDNSEKISIVDKTEENSIEIDSKNNSLKILAGSELEIQAGSKVEVHTQDGHKIMLDSSGIKIEAANKDLTLKAMNVTIESDMNVDIKAGMNMTVEGKVATTVKGSVGLDLDGGAKLTAKGGVVMIN
jgi:phage protein D/phage baseplate assembly protein gpV